MNAMISRFSSGREIDVIMIYPLQWPADRGRSTTHFNGAYKHPLTTLDCDEVNDALRRLRAQFHAVGSVDAIQVSFNLAPWPLSGDLGRWIEPTDSGVVVRFKLCGEAFEMVCDRWSTVANNIAVIAAHLDALNWQHQRGIMSLQDSLRGFSAPAAANDGCRGNTAAMCAAREIPGIKSVSGRP